MSFLTSSGQPITLNPSNLFVDDVSTTSSAQTAVSLSTQKKDNDGIVGHSWFGKVGHIIRDDGRVLRCEIREIVLRPCFIGISVRYREGGKSKKRQYSPIFLASAHAMWWNHDIVSEEDLETTIHAVGEVLPPLRLLRSEEAKLSQEQKLAMMWTLQQSDCIQKKISE